MRQTFQLYHKPKRLDVPNGPSWARVLWLWRRGGWNPADESYGRCICKSSAKAIIQTELRARAKQRTAS